MAESITEGTLKQWNKKVGDFVQADEEVATIETDKVSSSFLSLRSRSSASVSNRSENDWDPARERRTSI